MITNVAAYQFAKLSDLPRLREFVLVECREAGLKGTVLLSPEGVNLFLAGERAGVDAVLSALRTIPGLEYLTAKYSESESIPFDELYVKLKREIIAFGVPSVDPRERSAPRVSPRELKAWLDAGRPVVLVDTRNEYEIEHGTFRGARTLGLRTFREFPAAASALSEELRSQPVVTFCTGGIRCEKAALLMEQLGFEQVWQLDGGILKYFEECGDSHYDGACFVFDQRETIAADELHRTAASTSSES